MIEGALPAISGSATLDLTVQVRDEENNELIDLAGMVINFVMAPFGSWPTLWDEPASFLQPELIASTETGEITVIDMGTFQVLVASSVIRSMNAGNYDAGCTVRDPTDDDYVAQILIGTINVIPGIVRNP